MDIEKCCWSSVESGNTRRQWKRTIDSTYKCHITAIYEYVWRVQIMDRHCLLLRTSPSHVGKHANSLFNGHIKYICFRYKGYNIWARVHLERKPSVFFSSLRPKNSSTIHVYLFRVSIIFALLSYKFCIYCNPVNSKLTRPINLQYIDDNKNACLHNPPLWESQLRGQLRVLVRTPYM